MTMFAKPLRLLSRIDDAMMLRQLTQSSHRLIAIDNRLDAARACHLIMTRLTIKNLLRLTERR